MRPLVDTFFTADIHGHGGDHRTTQLAEILREAEIETALFQRTILKTSKERYLSGLQAVCNPRTYQFIAQHQLHPRQSPNAIAFCGFQRQLYTQQLTQHSGSPVLLWEATKNYVAPFVASEVGFKTIALPHNLEALVPGQVGFESLETELQALKKADAVFCVAREEEWLLRTQGANAFYFPYYPPRHIFDRMLKVREARASSNPSRFLILGNAQNPPTAMGMRQQLDSLQQLSKVVPLHLDVVGYDTEQFQEAYASEDFRIHGGVSSAQLHEFLIQAKAALIHQVPTSGALTRVPELLLAGIPVIGNRNACRSTADYVGVYAYDDEIELAALLSRDFPTPPVPDRPIAAEKRFIDLLTQFCSL